MLETTVSGMSVTVLVLIFTDNGSHPTAKVVRRIENNNSSGDK